MYRLLKSIMPFIIFLPLLFTACTTETPVNKDTSITENSNKTESLKTSSPENEVKTSPAAIETEQMLYEGYYSYIILSDGTVQIEHYKGEEEGLLEIPSSINGLTVTKIGIRAFATNLTYILNFTSVIIPESVTEIKAQAFYGCEKLTNVTIPESVTIFGGEIFDKTPFMDNYKDDLLIINNRLLRCKGSEKNVVIPDYVIEIAPRAFLACENIESITIPDNGLYIGYEAFLSCHNLSVINIPESITEFAHHAFSFSEFMRLASSEILVIINNILVHYDPAYATNVEISESRGITKIAGGAFYNNDRLKSVVLPNGVLKINERAFYDCLYLKNVTIPDSVTEIEKDAFFNCINVNVLCSEGSYAQQYCIENNINHEII